MSFSTAYMRRHGGLALLKRPRAVPLALARRERLIVVGNGMVGQHFCERLVGSGGAHRYKIVVIGEERIPAYDRVHLADVLRGRNPDELLLRSPPWYAEHEMDLRLDERVEFLDPEARRVATSAGTVLTYDKLVFATGSRASIPPVQVDDGFALLPYRTMEDAQRILRSVETRSRPAVPVAVIGGGLLGVEAARALQQLGCRVVVLESASQLLPRQLDPEAAAELEQALTSVGIDVRLKMRISRISGDDNAMRIELDGAPVLEASVVVAAAGARARDEVARSAGLRCHPRGGIRVDRALRTNDPNIFAIGECAAHEGVPHGLVAPGYAMAEVLADNLMGRRRQLGPQHAITRLKLDVTEVTVLGNPLESVANENVVWQAPGRYRRLIVHGRRVVGAICVGSWDELAEVQRLVFESRRVDRRRLERFARGGSLGLVAAAGSDVLSWPDAAVVCQCANVTCGTLRSAVARGQATPDSLARATSASTLCGSCQPLLSVLCGQTPVATQRSRGLAAAAAVAMVLAAVTLVVPRIPVAQSIERQGIDLLWIDSTWKQITGFGLIALVAIGLLLSARKRLQWFRVGAYPLWRTLHGVLGAVGLVALFVHTGFRLGHNFNLALMIALLTSAMSGAAAGFFAVLATRTQPNAMAQRLGPLARTLHDYAFWPVPILVAFHVFKVYYY